MHIVQAPSYCSLNTGWFKLWHITMNNVRANLLCMVLKIITTENIGKNDLATS